jgi:hypothetical protein
MTPSEPPVLQDESPELKEESLWLSSFRVSFDTSMVNPHGFRVILQGLLLSIDCCLESLDGSMVTISGYRMISNGSRVSLFFGSLVLRKASKAPV